jgi:hypothetical protein
MAGDFSRDSANSVVVDNRTNLMWQDDANANTTKRTWSGAITYCEDLTLATHSDWRLPNKNELKSIVDRSKDNPAMSEVFQNRVSSSYWSSSTFAGDSTDAWFVYFGNGGDYFDVKTFTYYVRCVR